MYRYIILHLDIIMCISSIVDPIKNIILNSSDVISDLKLKPVVSLAGTGKYSNVYMSSFNLNDDQLKLISNLNIHLDEIPRVSFNKHKVCYTRSIKLTNKQSDTFHDIIKRCRSAYSHVQITKIS